jgi:hypothetical protein
MMTGRPCMPANEERLRSCVSTTPSHDESVPRIVANEGWTGECELHDRKVAGMAVSMGQASLLKPTPAHRGFERVTRHVNKHIPHRDRKPLKDPQPLTT